MSSTQHRYQRTRWQGVYKRNGRYHGRLYTGKHAGVSQYEWLDGEPTGKAAADKLAKARAGRAPRRGGHTVATWAKRTPEHPNGYWLALRPRQKASSNRSYADQAAPFVARYGDLPLAELDGDVELALDWIIVQGMRWTLGGVRAMATDARRAGIIDTNPFLGLGVSTGPGRKEIEVLTEPEVHDLARAAEQAWSRDGYGIVWRALVYWQAYVGTRPTEAYGLTRPDLDLNAGEVTIARQRPPQHGRTPLTELPAPKNGHERRVIVHPLALEAIAAIPPRLRADALFYAKRGGPLHGGSQHYYWHPIRTLFGRPDLDLYELRHFCGSYHLNVLELAAQDVAQQLGHSDGGVLVQRLYGHPSEDLARRRIAAAHHREPPVLLDARGATS